jgi:hypothetical protein
MARFPTVLLVAGSLALGACAAPGGPEGEANESRSISTDWVRTDQVRDFRVLDAGNLVLYAPTRRQAYHVELLPPCQGLRFADSISIRGRGGRLGGFAGDSIVVPRAGSPERCPVSSVRRLSEAELAELIVQFEGEGDAPPAAEETEIEIPRRDPSSED